MRHELCHAADSTLGWVSLGHMPDGELPEDKALVEAFAAACEQGPSNTGRALALADACPSATLNPPSPEALLAWETVWSGGQGGAIRGLARPRLRIAPVQETLGLPVRWTWNIHGAVPGPDRLTVSLPMSDDGLAALDLYPNVGVEELVWLPGMADLSWTGEGGGQADFDWTWEQEDMWLGTWDTVPDGFTLGERRPIPQVEEVDWNQMIAASDGGWWLAGHRWLREDTEGNNIGAPVVARLTPDLQISWQEELPVRGMRLRLEEYPYSPQWGLSVAGDRLLLREGFQDAEQESWAVSLAVDLETGGVEAVEGSCDDHDWWGLHTSLGDDRAWLLTTRYDPAAGPPEQLWFGEIQVE